MCQPSNIAGNTPLVSIIIPTYNRGHVIKLAIESALNQTYLNKEIVVVDDGSSDDTEAVVKSFHTVTYIRQNHKGQGAARNKGLQSARGEFIASLDSDDIWDACFLSKCLEILLKYHLDFVFANWWRQTQDGNPIDSLKRHDFLKPYIANNTDTGWTFLDQPNLRKLYLAGCPSPSSSAVIRRSSLPSGWSENFTIADDWVLFLDIIMAKNCRAAFTMEKLWYKRTGLNNIYDGRNTIEVMKYLGVEDFSLMIRRFSKHFTSRELKYVKQVHTANMLKLSGLYFLSMDLKNGILLILDVFRKEHKHVLPVLANVTQRKISLAIKNSLRLLLSVF